MASSEISLLNRVLKVNPPWTVRSQKMSEDGTRLDLWIGHEPTKGWLGGTIAPAQEREAAKPWRHVGMGSPQIHIHLLAAPNESPGKQDWAQHGTMPFSYAMTRIIFNLMVGGIDLASIGKLLDVSLADLWAFKYAIDNGQLRMEAPPVVAAAVKPVAAQVATPAAASSRSTTTPPATVGAGPAPARVEPLRAAVALGVPAAAPSARRPAGFPAPAAAAAVSIPSIPGPNDPVWAKILNREIDLNINSLNLKLFVTPIQWQLANKSNPNLLSEKARELQRFFQRNAHQLAHELKQLRA